jgi:protocatechuate 3,4-dioxygenase beta subunit
MRAVIAVLVIGAMASSAATATAAPLAQCAPTPNSGGGPDRGPIALHAKIGTGHVLTGVVLSPACTPIPGARVSFWQSNTKGVYTTAGRGAVVTDKSGRFRFEGPMPVAYDGRPGHIHIKVQARDYETLYTEYEPHGARTGNVRLVLVPAAL